MKKQTSLSDKIKPIPKGLTCICGNCDLRTIRVEDVKQFIKELKEAGSENDWDIMLMDGEDGDITISFNDWIDKLAGDKLI